MQPLPPSPATTSMVASSTNFMVVGIGCSPDVTAWRSQKKKPRRAGASSCCEPPARPVAGARSERLDEHRLAVERALDGIAHFAVDQREQRVVLAGADIAAGMELGAALTHEDRAGRDLLAAEHLHAEHLRLGVAAVPCGAAALFLCHGCCSLRVHRTDLNLGVVLTMTLPLLIVLATAHLEDAHLVMPAMRHNGGHHACARYQGSPDGQIGAGTNGQHLVDRDLLANIRSNLFYFDLFAGNNLVLLATGFYDRVHISPF